VTEILDTLEFLLVLGVLAAAGFYGFRFYRRGIQVMPKDMIGVIHRRSLRVDRRDVHAVRVFGSPGPQARVLPAGSAGWLFPYLYTVEAHPAVVVPPFHVGVVRAHVGGPLGTDIPVAKPVTCSYADGAAFLAEGGEQGPQPRLLAPGVHSVNPLIFTVEVVPQVRIRPGMVGIVIAKTGLRPQRGRPIARHVECAGFQDAAAFLLGGGEQGPQPALLPGGGQYSIHPDIFEVREVPQIRIAPGNVGVVTAQIGANLPLDRPVARHVECDNFQDATAFLHGNGEQGPQPALLTGGGVYDINSYAFEVREIPQVEIRPGRIGLVVAQIGAHLAPGRPFARHVECDNFQDAPGFLARGGQQGRQLAVLTGGSRYNINPHVFEVITEDNVETKRNGLTPEDLQPVELFEGNTGVVVVRDGAAPVTGHGPAQIVDGHDRFQLPWVFLANGGVQGTQAETLPAGPDYHINPWFARVVRIPTRILIMEWKDKVGPDDGDRYDSALVPINTTVEGHAVEVHLTQSLTIPPSAGPQLVWRFGEQETEHTDQYGLVNSRPAPVKRFVERILGSVVRGYFSSTAAQNKIHWFVANPGSIQNDLNSAIQLKMQEWDVEAHETTLVSFKVLDESFNEGLQELVKEEQRNKILVQQKINHKIQKEIQRGDLEVELDRERALKGINTADGLEAMIKLVGRDEALRDRLIRQLTEFDVPQVIAGNQDLSELTHVVPLTMLRDMLRKVVTDRRTIAGVRIEEPPPPHPDLTQVDREPPEPSPGD
jgi:hypothetical protein